MCSNLYINTAVTTYLLTFEFSVCHARREGKDRLKQN